MSTTRPIHSIQRHSSSSPETPLNTVQLNKGKVSKFELQLNPQEITKHLGSVLQDSEFSLGERKKVFKEVVKKVISHPSNPYSRLSPGLQEDMIQKISAALADSPNIKAPKFS